MNNLNRSLSMNNQKGVTLFELIIVLTVLGILSAGAREAQSRFEERRIVRQTVEGFATLDEGLYAYNVINGSFPANVSDLTSVMPNLQGVNTTTGEGGVNGLGGSYSLVPYPDGIGIITQMDTLAQARRVASEFPNTSSVDTTNFTVTFGIPVAGMVSLMDGFLPKDGSEPMEGDLDMDDYNIQNIDELHANIMYDRGDNNYYLNPAGRSELNTADFRSMRDQDNTAFTIDPSGNSELNTLAFSSATDRDNPAYLLDPSGRSELNTLDVRSIRDQDDVNYLLDPSSRSELNTLDVRSIRDQDNTAYTLDPSGRSELNTLDVRSLRDQDNTAYYIDPASRSNTYEMQSRRYYDDNTAYYGDFNSRSQLNTFDFASARDRNNTAYTIDPSSRSQLNTFDFASARDRNNTAYLIDPASHSELNTFDAAYMRDQNNTAYTIDPSSRSQLNTFDFASARDRNNTAYTIDPSGRSELNTVDFRSMRDQDNTGYTIDPSSTSRMNYVNANRVRAQSSHTIGSSCTTYGAGTYARSGSSPIFCNGSTWQRIGGASVSVTLDRSYNTPGYFNIGRHHICSLTSTSFAGNYYFNQGGTADSTGRLNWYVRVIGGGSTSARVRCITIS